MERTVRLKDNRVFLALFKKGKFVCGRCCVVYFRKNGSSENRLGVSTGKKTGNAVVRSRCRRIIRQAYRENEELFPKGFDIVIVSRTFTGQCKSTDINSFLRKKVIPEMKGCGKGYKGNKQNSNTKCNNKEQNTNSK